MDIVLLFGSREGRRRLIIMKVVDAPHGRKASPAAACSRSRGPAPGFARGTDALLSGVQPAPDLPKMQAAVRAMRIFYELRRLLLAQGHLVQRFVNTSSVSKTPDNRLLARAAQFRSHNLAARAMDFRDSVVVIGHKTQFF